MTTADEKALSLRARELAKDGMTITSISQELGRGEWLHHEFVGSQGPDYQQAEPSERGIRSSETGRVGNAGRWVHLFPLGCREAFAVSSEPST